MAVVFEGLFRRQRFQFYPAFKKAKKGNTEDLTHLESRFKATVKDLKIQQVAAGNGDPCGHSKPN